MRSKTKVVKVVLSSSVWVGMGGVIGRESEGRKGRRREGKERRRELTMSVNRSKDLLLVEDLLLQLERSGRGFLLLLPWGVSRGRKGLESDGEADDID